MTADVSGSVPNLQTVKDLALKHRTWNHWGPDDELGAMNYVSPEAIVAAATLVRKGKVISLALPLDSSGPQTGALGRVNPVHSMIQDGGDIALGSQDSIVGGLRFTDDAVYMPLQCATQWDALAHIFHDGQMYNGYGLEYVDSKGARRNAITNINEKAVGRGVLLDVARFKGQRWLDVGYPIEGADLEGCCEAQGVKVEQGDFVLVRTGRIGFVREQGSWGTSAEYTGGDAPGLALSSADVLCGWRVAAVATDTWGAEVRPNETADVYQPLHIVLLVNAGIWIGEMFDLEALSADCAEDGVYEFMFVAPPLTITGAVGSPVNPQAIK